MGEHQRLRVLPLRQPHPRRAGGLRGVAGGGAHGLAFASGLAAEDNMLRLLRPGDGVVLGNDAYGGTFRLIARSTAPTAIRGRPSTSPTSTRCASLVARRPAMVWLETPTNPLLTCIDIEAVAAVAHDKGALVVVDNTFATPYLQQPLPWAPTSSCTRPPSTWAVTRTWSAGSSPLDDDELAERLRFTQNAAGAVPAPFDCYLVLRGVKTLAVRMDRHCANARAVVDVLVGHPAVERVLYPQLPDHPGPRRGGAADARLRRHGQLHASGRRGRRARRRRPHRAVHAGRVARCRRDR